LVVLVDQIFDGVLPGGHLQRQICHGKTQLKIMTIILKPLFFLVHIMQIYLRNNHNIGLVRYLTDVIHQRVSEGAVRFLGQFVEVELHLGPHSLGGEVARFQIFLFVQHCIRNFPRVHLQKIMSKHNVLKVADKNKSNLKKI
jgi:hypothetical protein